MKAFLILLVGIIALSSCHKTHCYICVLNSDDGISTPTSDTSEQCGWTEKQMLEHTKAMTHSWNNGGYMAADVMICTEK